MPFDMMLFTLSFGCYLLAFIGHSGASMFLRHDFGRLGRLVFFIGALLGLAGLGLRWNLNGYPPLSNLFESMMVFSTFFALISLWFSFSQYFPLLEAGMATGAVLLSGVGAMFVQEGHPLPPALQSPWMQVHVSLAFLGAACFAVSFLLSYLYAARRLTEDEKDVGSLRNQDFPMWEQTACLAIVFGIPLGSMGIIVFVWHRLGILSKNVPSMELLGYWPSLAGMMQGKVWQTQVLLGAVAFPALLGLAVFFFTFFLLRGAGKTADQWVPSLLQLEEMNYQAIALGYPLYSIGAILFGMLWADSAWGRYWSWDPKETWAFITFLGYSMYLHLRLVKGWRSTHGVILSIIGFGFTLFTIFGVTFFLPGLHSYASW